jgi:uncharacterized Ntn-hydrolase superfamily protein
MKMRASVIGSAVSRCVLAAIFLAAGQAHATWSVIVLDRETHNIGLAGASCSDYVAGIAGYVPGKGAVMAQAASNWQAKTKAEELIRSGTAPDQILAAITDPNFDPDFSRQQYAIMTFQAFDKPVTYTGTNTEDYHGAITGDGFSTQGNMLPGSAVLEAVATSINATRKAKQPIAEILLSALEAGASAGGDKRCGKQRSTSAFITVIRPDLPWWEPYLNLNVHHVRKGGPDAVAMVRGEYRRWKAHYHGSRSTSWAIAPQP